MRLEDLETRRRALLLEIETIEGQLASAKEETEAGVRERNERHLSWLRSARYALARKRDENRALKLEIEELKAQAEQTGFSIDASDPRNLLAHALQKLATLLQEVELVGDDERALMAAIRQYLYEKEGEQDDAVQERG